MAYQIHYFETSIVDVGQTIMEYYSRKAPWEELKGYLDCVYDLADPNAPAGPGSNYKKIDKRAIDCEYNPIIMIHRPSVSDREITRIENKQRLCLLDKKFITGGDCA